MRRSRETSGGPTRRASKKRESTLDVDKCLKEKAVDRNQFPDVDLHDRERADVVMQVDENRFDQQRDEADHEKRSEQFGLENRADMRVAE